MTDLRSLCLADPFDPAATREYLDGLDHETRLAQVRTLGLRHQRRLFEGVKGFMALDLDYYVSSDVEAGVPVRHHGKNTLPVFTRFAKPMMRPPGGLEGELWGYNDSGWIVGTFVGPGYFRTVPHSEEGEVLIDYLTLPDGKHESWPALIGNEKRLSRFVYYQTQDVMRGVSSHVSIGRAMKKGKWLPAFFTLCRED